MNNEGPKYEETEIPYLEPSAFSEIEACISTALAESSDGVHRPILIADEVTEMEFTIDDAIRLRDWLNEAIHFLDGRRNGLM